MILALTIASIIFAFTSLLANIYIVCVFGKPFKYESKNVSFAYFMTAGLFIGLTIASVFGTCVFYGLI